MLVCVVFFIFCVSCCLVTFIHFLFDVPSSLIWLYLWFNAFDAELSFSCITAGIFNLLKVWSFLYDGGSSPLFQLFSNLVVGIRIPWNISIVTFRDGPDIRYPVRYQFQYQAYQLFQTGFPVSGYSFSLQILGLIFYIWPNFKISIRAYVRPGIWPTGHPANFVSGAILVTTMVKE